MLRAIIGGIVGSRFEFNNHRSKEFDFKKGLSAILRISLNYRHAAWGTIILNYKRALHFVYILLTNKISTLC